MIPRVLFLDIDGVLNCSRCIQLSDDMLHTGHVRQLERIVSATECEVVISSTWRLIHTIPNLLMQLRHRGYSHGILSTTPVLTGRTRGDEIKAWLACHPTETFAIVGRQRRHGRPVGTGRRHHLEGDCVECHGSGVVGDVVTENAYRVCDALSPEQQDELSALLLERRTEWGAGGLLKSFASVRAAEAEDCAACCLTGTIDEIHERILERARKHREGVRL